MKQKLLYMEHSCYIWVDLYFILTKGSNFLRNYKTYSAGDLVVRRIEDIEHEQNLDVHKDRVYRYFKVISYKLFLIEIPASQSEFVGLKFARINPSFTIEAIAFIKHFFIKISL